jgi:hypothetical protein
LVSERPQFVQEDTCVLYLSTRTSGGTNSLKNVDHVWVEPNVPNMFDVLHNLKNWQENWVNLSNVGMDMFIVTDNLQQSATDLYVAVKNVKESG